MGFNQWNANSPDLSASFAQSGDIVILSITGGYGGGYSVSGYPTTTFNTAGFSSIWPINVEPPHTMVPGIGMLFILLCSVATITAVILVSF